MIVFIRFRYGGAGLGKPELLLPTNIKRRRTNWNGESSQERTSLTGSYGRAFDLVNSVHNPRQT
jgi:hypothetical protein